MNKFLSYQNVMQTFVFDQDNRMPLWVVDDLIINTNNLKVEAFVVKDSLFKAPKILSTASVPNWWKDIYISAYSLKEIEKTTISKQILEKWIWVIWNKVEDEQWQTLWMVTDLYFSKNTYQWISIMFKPFLMGLIPIWKWREITKKNIIDIKKDKIIIRDVNLAKTAA